ncbi:MAG: hypothetical protein ACI9VR_004457 [Cognaticolwellia sp.]|jgi:hypothetical protein
MQRTHGLALASILLLGAASIALASSARRSRLPWMQIQVQQVLEQTPCGQELQLSDAQLIAALRTGTPDPCGRLDATILKSPSVDRWLQTQVLGELPGPESLRLRAAQSLMRLEAPQRAAAELQTGALGPEARQALIRSLNPQLEGLDLPFEPTGRSAAKRFSRGDSGAREELADALFVELRWPTLVNEDQAPEQAALPQTLVDSALSGLGWSSRLLSDALDDLVQGRPVQNLDGYSLRLLQQGGSDCSQTDPACLTLLLNELDAQAGAPRAPLTPLAGVAAEDLPLFYRAAESISDSPNPEGRLLGLIAHPAHSYGALAWSAGQRGEPVLVLRHGGGTPAASATAALALGQASGLPVQVYGQNSDALIIEVGSRRAHIGPCGPGTAFGSGDLPQLSPEEVIAWALRERVAGLAAAGDIEAALLASVAENGQIGTPQWMALRGGLLACQGIRLPGLLDPSAAADWAQACAQPTWSPTPEMDTVSSAEAQDCKGSLWVDLPVL